MGDGRHGAERRMMRSGRAQREIVPGSYLGCSCRRRLEVPSSSVATVYTVPAPRPTTRSFRAISTRLTMRPRRSTTTS